VPDLVERALAVAAADELRDAILELAE